MSEYTWEQFEELFELSPKFSCEPSASLEKKYKSTIEVTFNYPHTIPFLRCTAEEQKAIYRNLFFYVCLHTPNVIRTSYALEYYESGHVHLHGYIQVGSESTYFIDGLCQSIVKTYLSQLPKKYSAYKDKLYYWKFHRYRSPSCVIQYRASEEVERFINWENYISKNT